MKALVFQDVKQVSCERVPDPSIEDPRDIIVKSRCSGLCGSDLHVYHGREQGLDAGTVMGHELVGEIVEVGNQVSKLKKGDVVFCPFTTNCNACYYCEVGLTSRCERGQLFGWVEKGKGLHGTQSEYVRIPLAETTVMKVPAELPVEDALLMGDNFTTGFFCAEMAEIKPEGTYLVLGCGTVGLMTIQAARELGAEKLYAFDPVSYRARQATDFGAVGFSDPVELEAVIKDATKGRGVDSVLEVVGNLEAQELAICMLRPGGILAVAGVHTAERFSFSPVDAFDMNLTYKTGRCSARAYMERYLPLVLERKLGLGKRFVTHRLSLDQGPNAYEMFSQKTEDCLKVVFE